MVASRRGHHAYAKFELKQASSSSPAQPAVPFLSQKGSVSVEDLDGETVVQACSNTSSRMVPCWKTFHLPCGTVIKQKRQLLQQTLSGAL